MIKLLAVVLMVLPPIPAAAFWQSRDTNYGRSMVAAAPYVGPGDVASGAVAWYGVRGYNAAYSTGANNAINVRRTSDNAVQDIKILSNGNLDLADANAFAGVDVTCTGSTTGSSTTINFTGCSGTPHPFDTLTGTGIVQPVVLASCGAFAAGAGSCTLSIAQNLASTTVTMQWGLFVTAMYDQSGNGHTASQATAGSQPQLVFGCNNTSCLYLSNVAPQCVSASTFALGAGTYSAESVFYNLVSAGYATVVALESSGNYLLDMNAGTLDWYLAGDQNLAGTAIGNWYAAVAVSGASGSVNANALTAAATRTVPATTGEPGVGGWGGQACGNPLIGYIGEGGIWPSAIATPATMISNARSYWGF